MIRKLRIKFVLTSMISVLVVLIILLGGINLSNYIKVVSDSDKVLDLLASNGGMFPMDKREEVKGGAVIPEERIPEEREAFKAGKRDDRIASPEIAFETRYFTVLFDKDGNYIKSDVGKISAVSESLAEAYGEKVLESGKNKGFYGDYRYIVSDLKDDGLMVIFCDRGPGMANFRTFRNNSIIFSMIVLFIIGGIIFIISGRVVKPVAEAYEKQKRFISDAGHEIKTPLAIINADADVLMMDTDEDNEWILDIKKQTQRLTKMTNDLIRLSKLDEGREEYEETDYNLSEAVADITDSFKSMAERDNKRLITNHLGDVIINGDEKSIRAIIMILVENAVKYCPEGGTISTDIIKDNKKVKFIIENDTSDEIDKNRLLHIFDRFYRLDESRNSDLGGFGLGLSIAKSIAANNGVGLSVKVTGHRKIAFILELS